MNEDQIRAELGKFPEWRRGPGGEMSRTFEFSGFPRALVFANAVGHLAEKANHHPDILIKYNQVTLMLSTHETQEGQPGLTLLDFDLAGQIDRLAF